MRRTYNIYCDESCHLEHDAKSHMVLGGVYCPIEKSWEISRRIAEIKSRNGIVPAQELKWTKVSPAKLRLYMDLVDYFLDDDDLHFRCIVADKSGLRHDDFEQTHDDWYFKMYFDMLRVIFEPEASYNIYLDIKDTRSSRKTAKLHEVLCSDQYDFSRNIILKVQHVRSHEVQLVQLADILIGAVSYANRELSASEAKLEIIDRLKKRLGYKLTRSTLLREQKFNVFRWLSKEKRDVQ